MKNFFNEILYKILDYKIGGIFLGIVGFLILAIETPIVVFVIIPIGLIINLIYCLFWKENVITTSREILTESWKIWKKAFYDIKVMWRAIEDFY